MDKVEMGRSRGDMRVAVRATLALEGGLKAQLRRVRRLKAVLAAAASAEKVAMVADAVGSLIEPRLVEVLGMFPDADELQPAPPPAGLEVLEPSFRFQDTEYVIGAVRGDGMINATYRRGGCDLESVWTARTLFAISLARTHGSPRVVAAINGLTTDPERAESDWDFVAGSSPSRVEAMFHVAMTWLERRPDVTMALGLK